MSGFCFIVGYVEHERDARASGGEVTINDYWNLREHPLYFHLDKKKKPYVIIRELPAEGYVKIDSLQKLSNHLSKFDWTFQPRYWSEICHVVQAVVNTPYIDL